MDPIAWFLLGFIAIELWSIDRRLYKLRGKR